MKIKLLNIFLKFFKINQYQDIPEEENTDNFLLKNILIKLFDNNEINKNKPSRSAKLRFAIRSNNNFIYPEDLIKKFSKYLDIEAINVKN